MSVVHLCIDVQRVYPEYFEHCGLWWDTMRSTIDGLINSLTARDVPTIYVAAANKFIGEVSELGHISRHNARILRAYPSNNIDFPLEPQDLVAFKTGASACKESAIAQYLDSIGASRLILSGIYEDNFDDNKLNPGYCLTQTAVDFRKAGYEVTIAAEATNQGAYAKQKLEGGLDLKQRIYGHNYFDVALRPIKQILADLDKRASRSKFSASAPSFVHG
jgi:nicotinamidase-related amidase